MWIYPSENEDENFNTATNGLCKVDDIHAPDCHWGTSFPKHMCGDNAGQHCKYLIPQIIMQ